MSMRFLTRGGLPVSLCLVALGCGSGGPGASPTPTAAAYCSAFASYRSTSDALDRLFTNSTPDLASIRSLIGQLSSGAAAMDAAAPPGMKSDLDALRQAVDSMNSAVEKATSLREAEMALASGQGPALTAAAEVVARNTERLCGLASPSTH